MPTYRKAYRPPLPRHSRTLPIHGTGDDADRYFHCWNCGFVCDADRDELGDSDSYAGDDHAEYLRYAGPSTIPDNLGRTTPKSLCLGGPVQHFEVLTKPDAAGDPKKVMYNIKSDVSSGCPFCGTKNWRGDY